MADPSFGQGKLSIPAGISLEEYYGGFFPTEEWIAALEPLPRDQRGNPNLLTYIQTVTGTGADEEMDSELPASENLESIRADMMAYMRVEPEAYLGLVPRRNRLAGNTRVMPRDRRTLRPLGVNALVWTPDKPDELRDDRGRAVDPLQFLPPTGVHRITGPRGDLQEYPYHDMADGTRVYVQSEFMDSMRVQELSRAVRRLGKLYHQSGDIAYAQRAAAILYDFACAVPHWPKIARGLHSGFEAEDRFRPIKEIIIYAGIWGDKYYTGLPEDLAIGYDLIANADVWDQLDKQAGGDARMVIDHDLFLYTIKDALRYDVAFPNPTSTLSNLVPYQTRGLICIGAAAGLPELVHYAKWKIEQMVEKTLMVDGVFPEGPSYFRQHVFSMATAARYGQGYSDPPGFVSTIDGGRMEDMDIIRDLPKLTRALNTLGSMTYPTGQHITLYDTKHFPSRSHYAQRERLDPQLFHAFGHGILARGARENDSLFQAHLGFAGNWGHDHRDMLNLILWPYNEELVCDIGYVHTYRQYASESLGHNLVVVDRRTQEKVNDPGNVLAWHPVRDGLQVIQVAAPHVYPDKVRKYQRTLMLIPAGERDSLVLDIFEVEGGGIHEWMAHGSGTIDQTVSLSLAVSEYGESYADDRKPFEPPPHYAEYRKQRLAQKLPAHELGPRETDPWYGVFRDVKVADISGAFEARIDAHDSTYASLRLHVLSPGNGRAFTATAPSCRLGAAQDVTLVEKNRMPKLILRRDGENLRSRFVILWEPQRGQTLVRQASMTETDGGLLVNIELADGKHWRIMHSADPARPFAVGGYELAGRTAAIAACDEGRALFLYDATRLTGPGLNAQTQQRVPLALVKADHQQLVLEGTWADISEAVTFDEPVFATLTLDGGGHRAMPVVGIEPRGNQTILHGSFDFGFTYDPQVKQLTETYFPYRELAGAAMVALPNRVVARWQGDSEVQVQNSVPVTLDGKDFNRSTTW